MFDAVQRSDGGDPKKGQKSKLDLKECGGRSEKRAGVIIWLREKSMAPTSLGGIARKVVVLLITLVRQGASHGGSHATNQPQARQGARRQWADQGSI